MRRSSRPRHSPSPRRNSPRPRRTSRRPVAVRPLRRNYNERGFEVEPREGEDPRKQQIREEMIRKLAGEWNQVEEEREQRSFRSREDREADMEMLWERLEDEAREQVDAMSPEQIEALGGERQAVLKIQQDLGKKHQGELRERDEELRLRREVIEELLHDLGGRMMRPYEHWNEEEAYREYAERDRPEDYEDDY